MPVPLIFLLSCLVTYEYSEPNTSFKVSKGNDAKEYQANQQNAKEVVFMYSIPQKFPNNRHFMKQSNS